MLFVRFQIGESTYVINSEYVREIVPCLPVEPIASAPSAILGKLDYRGCPVPVIDLKQLLLQEPCEQRLGSRIIICGSGNLPTFGVLAEHATSLLEVLAEDLIESGHGNDPYQAELVRASDPLIYVFNLKAILEDKALAEFLRKDPREAS